MELRPMVAALSQECVRIRRELHQIPETAYTEEKTQAYILSYLAPLKPDRLTTLAGTGVKAVFLCPKAEKTIAFRADIDGLPIQEQNEIKYASTHSGRMHACGHDGHTTAALLLCRLISQHREQLHTNVVILFQPGEEGAGGARRMIDDGALQDPAVDCIYGFHVWPELEKGRLGFRQGAFMAQSCGFDLTIKGKSAHGAHPDRGIDAVVAAAEVISVLQTVVSRFTNPEEPIVLTIGKIHGGQRRNIICDKVVMNGTLRTFSDEIHDQVYDRIQKILQGFEQATGVETEFAEVQRYYCVKNPEPLASKFEALMGTDIMSMERLMIGEDFSFYQQQIPGLFFLVGVQEHDGAPSLHSPHFDFDETALLYGIEAYCRILQLQG